MNKIADDFVTYKSLAGIVCVAFLSSWWWWSFLNQILDSFAHFHALFVRWKIVAVAIAAAEFEFFAVLSGGIIAPAWNQCPAKSFANWQYASFTRFHVFHFIADCCRWIAATACRTACQSTTRISTVRIIAARYRINQIRHPLQQLFTTIANDFIIQIVRFCLTQLHANA